MGAAPGRGGPLVSRFQTLLLVVAGLNAAVSAGSFVRVVVSSRRLGAERRARLDVGWSAAVRGQVAVAELLEHGLAGQPDCVIGIGFRSPALAVLCRRHVDDEALAGLGAHADDEAAVLLVGGLDQGERLSWWCVVCRGLIPVADEIEKELVLAGGKK